MKKIIKMMVCLLSVCGVTNFALADSKKMSEIFSYDMIGIDISYLESLIGPARKTDEMFKKKTYIVDNCELIIGYDGPRIDTLKVTTSEKCSFILKDIVPFEQNLSTNKLTFGMSGPVDYYSDCLIGCGNAYDPRSHELYIGSSAENGYELLISSMYSNTDKWREFMIDKEGNEWVEGNGFNCNPAKYNQVAEKTLKGQKAETIMIGYGLEKKAELNFGCDNNFEDNVSNQTTSNTPSFIVRPSVSPNYGTYLARISIISQEDSIDITDIVVNRGNCKISRSEKGFAPNSGVPKNLAKNFGGIGLGFPIHLKYSQETFFEFMNCPNILEVEISTNRGRVLYTN